MIPPSVKRARVVVRECNAGESPRIREDLGRPEDEPAGWADVFPGDSFMYPWKLMKLGFPPDPQFQGEPHKQKGGRFQGRPNANLL